MRDSKFIFTIIILNLFIFCSDSMGGNKAKIDAVRAHLFYDHSGKISDDLFSVNNITLWNTIIGEGYAGNPSNATLIIVEISGNNISSNQNAKLSIYVSGSKGRRVSNLIRQFSIYDEYQKIYIPMFLQDTGCEPLTINTKLIGKGLAPSSLSKTIPFACGE